MSQLEEDPADRLQRSPRPSGRIGGRRDDFFMNSRRSVSCERPQVMNEGKGGLRYSMEVVCDGRPRTVPALHATLLGAHPSSRPSVSSTGRSLICCEREHEERCDETLGQG